MHGRHFVGANTTQCEPVEVPMCKGLVGYNMTRMPNQYGHQNQNEVYWALQPWWPYMDIGCSPNLRLLLCGMYLPKCTPGSSEVQLPCKETCRRAKNACSVDLRRQGRPWVNYGFRCPNLPAERSRKCIPPAKERKKKRRLQYVVCQKNTLSICANNKTPYTFGSVPNMFLQWSVREMEKELRQYKPLIASGCSEHLSFFLCGTYMPYCSKESKQEVPFVVPCRELCQEVYNACISTYTQQRNGMPWPGKFHCHRFPSYVESYSNGNNSIPCTMQPYAIPVQGPTDG